MEFLTGSKNVLFSCFSRNIEYAISLILTRVNIRVLFLDTITNNEVGTPGLKTHHPKARLAQSLVAPLVAITCSGTSHKITMIIS